MKNSKFLLFSIGTFLVLLISAASFAQDHKPWPVPDNAKKVKSPIKADDEAVNLGKSLYAKHCKSCHGKNGEGDGTKASELKTFPGDFTSQEFQGQTDGSIFYKTSEGREDMPSFKKKIADNEEIWQIVAYLRTLKSK